MSAADPIPAIREEDATGEVAAIFSDLRETLDVPFVNLIWRHLATIPGGLAWTWALVRPLYGPGRLDAAAAHLRSGLALPEVPALDGFVLDSAEVTARDRATIAALIGHYNTGNSHNLLALLAARAVLAGERGVPAAPSETNHAAAEPGRPAPDLVFPRLPGLDEMSPAMVALVRSLDEFGRSRPSPALASLYRHLAPWPGFLALARTALLPGHRDGTLRREAERTVERARALAGSLSDALGRPSFDLAPASRTQAQAGLDEFTQLMIGRMVVMGEALRRLLPPPEGG